MFKSDLALSLHFRVTKSQNESQNKTNHKDVVVLFYVVIKATLLFDLLKTRK